LPCLLFMNKHRGKRLLIPNKRTGVLEVVEVGESVNDLQVVHGAIAKKSGGGPKSTRREWVEFRRENQAPINLNNEQAFFFWLSELVASTYGNGVVVLHVVARAEKDLKQPKDKTLALLVKCLSKKSEFRMEKGKVFFR
jgi:hypothetical protein